MKILEFAKKHKVKLIIVILIISYIALKPQPKPEIETLEVSMQDISQEVSVVGTVEAAQSAELAFEVSGKLQAINVNVNDEVKIGQNLASLNAADLAASRMNKVALLNSEKARLEQIQAQIDAEKSKLLDLQKGPKLQEVSLKEIELDNAKRNLEVAQSELMNLQNKLNAEIDTNFELLESVVRKSFTKNYNSLVELTDIQYEKFFGSGQESIKLASNKRPVVEILLGDSGGGKLNKVSLTSLNGGLKADLANFDLDKQATLHAYGKILNSISYTIRAFNNIDLSNRITETIQTNIQTQVTDLELSRNELVTQKSTLDNLINGYENSLDVKRNALIVTQNSIKQSESNLELTKSGATTEAIAAQEAAVRRYESDYKTQQAQIMAAQALVADANAQIAKRQIRAPFNGKITEKFFENGEIVSSQSKVLEIISEAKYEITANVPESDIAKIKLDQIASLTLDAYDDNTPFEAKVTKINPAAKEIEGVPVYEVTLNFVEASSLIKSGMTANLDILTNKTSDKLAIPLRAVENGYVKVPDQENEKGYSRVKVETGLVGTDGFIEVKSGLKEGDTIITYIEEENE